MLMWILWSRRNHKLWDDKGFSDSLVIQRGDQFFKIRFVLKLQRKVDISKASSIFVEQWCLLARGVLKCKVDIGFFFQQQNQIGTRICIRNFHGRLVIARIIRKQPCLKVNEGEAWGLLVVLQFVQRLWDLRMLGSKW